MNRSRSIHRLILRVLETGIVGPGYARLMFGVRNPKPLDSQKTWNLFTQRQGRLNEWFLDHYPPAFLIRLMRDLYYRRSFKFKDHASGISDHYDVSNQFYELFLDKKYMFYSCADFRKSTDTLEEAQENKANYLLNLLDPKPGEKILDLGCGWGAMLQKIYEKTGDKDNLYGYTLSKEQKKFIDAKYGFHVEYQDFISSDFEAASFDKIVSIGSVEHVREKELLPLAENLAKALRPGGKIVHHFFCQMREIPSPRLIGAFQVFPGSELSTLKQHLDAFEQAQLRIIHHSIHDYRSTLKGWFDRLAASEEAAIRFVGVHVYNKYLCYLAAAWRMFQDRELLVMRFVLERQDA